MIETLTRPATNAAVPAPCSPCMTVGIGAGHTIAATRLAAAGALGVSLVSRVGAAVVGQSSTALLVALLMLSLLAFVVAAVDPTSSKADERVASMCRRAAIVQSVVGVIALAVATF